MLRLTGGEFRGRMIHCPPSIRTRPTQARLRQALFNSLQTVIPGAKVLDLFCGAGTLGLEALSRGAERAAFIETDRTAIKLLEKNIADFALRDRVHVVSESVEWLTKHHAQIGVIGAPFDVVLADPPYSEGWEKRLLFDLPWDKLLVPEGVFCLEWGKLKCQDYKEGVLPDTAGFLVKVREKTYGDSVLTTFHHV